MPSSLAASRMVVPTGTLIVCPSMIARMVPPMASGMAVAAWPAGACMLRGVRTAPGSSFLSTMEDSLFRQIPAAERPRISPWKCSTMERKALGADCPSPHLEASCMVLLSPFSSRR